MPLTVEASSLFLNDVHCFLKLEKLSNASFADFLNLEALSEFEQQELLQISSDFERYLSAGKV